MHVEVSSPCLREAAARLHEDVLDDRARRTEAATVCNNLDMDDERREGKKKKSDSEPSALPVAARAKPRYTELPDIKGLPGKIISVMLRLSLCSRDLQKSSPTCPSPCQPRCRTSSSCLEARRVRTCRSILGVRTVDNSTNCPVRLLGTFSGSWLLRVLPCCAASLRMQLSALLHPLAVPLLSTVLFAQL